jgi:DNA-binding NtrC family response regulator
MPAQVVIVHKDQTFRSKAASAVAAEGCSVATYRDALAAMNALEGARLLEVLITSLNFEIGRSNGVSLARMARFRKSSIQTIFLVEPDMQDSPPDLQDLGILLFEPISLVTLVETVRECLDSPVVYLRPAWLRNQKGVI